MPLEVLCLDGVKTIEINHFNGAVFYNFRRSDDQIHDWRFPKQVKIRKDYALIECIDKKWRPIKYKKITHSHTEKDIEITERTIFPENMRRKLFHAR